MDGAHDTGGAPGFGPVRPEPDEPVFHAQWERRAFALTLAMAKPGGWNIDMSRFARENRPPADYLGKTYYEIWLAGLEQLTMERHLIAPDEIEAGHALHPPREAPVLAAGEVDAMLRRGGPSDRPIQTAPRFAIGDKVRTRTSGPATHTRLPRYVRGHVGTVVLVHGAHVFPDKNALGEGESPQWLYTVCFDGRDLWGEAGDPTVKTSVDAWDSYLEPA